MALKFKCSFSACGRTLDVTDEDLGQSSRCHHCGQALAIRVGRFHLRAKLGAGTFGTVYRAYDPQLEREVALKVPKLGTLDNDKAVARFLREAKAAANLHYPHIVTVYDTGFDG